MAEAGTIPSGGIIMWSGAVANIPQGWHLCDGANGTPDLEGKFIIGSIKDSGATYDVDDTGGVDEVTLTHEQSGVPAHTHKETNAPTAGSTHGCQPNSGTSGSQEVAHSTIANTAADAAEAHTNLPPYYALAFIMKS